MPILENIIAKEKKFEKRMKTSHKKSENAKYPKG